MEFFFEKPLNMENERFNSSYMFNFRKNLDKVMTLDELDSLLSCKLCDLTFQKVLITTTYSLKTRPGRGGYS